MQVSYFLRQFLKVVRLGNIAISTWRIVLKYTNKLSLDCKSLSQSRPYFVNHRLSADLKKK